MNLVFQSILKDSIVKLFWFRSVSLGFVSFRFVSFRFVEYDDERRVYNYYHSCARRISENLFGIIASIKPWAAGDCCISLKLL